MSTKATDIARATSSADFATHPALFDAKSDPSLISHIETIRLFANTQLDDQRRSEMGQFMTPEPVARLMASMFEDLTGDIHLLDAGAGVGSLTAAVVEEACNRAKTPRLINAYAYELEPALVNHLNNTLQLCHAICTDNDIRFNSRVFNTDFIAQATSLLKQDLFATQIPPRINRAILNPPYCKINSHSDTRLQLRSVGIETVNLYAGFVALAVLMLEEGGELVAITPRSFCNGPYFKPFRQLLFQHLTIKRIHIFDSRRKAFKGDNVLQENIILHAIKSKMDSHVMISSSACAEDRTVIKRTVPQQEITHPADPDLFIHISPSHADRKIAQRARSLPCSLDDLGIQVSTGRVVDFRATQHLCNQPTSSSVPLIYPRHFNNGFVEWPDVGHRKPNALHDCEDTASLMVPRGIYVLTKRFSSKEERRRVVAAIYDDGRIPASNIGFENHLNYFHVNGEGLNMMLAKGLTLFLNSSLVDQYFRQFNGHTQVNAADLRSLRYPTLMQLKQLGNRFRTRLPEQAHIDQLIDAILFNQAD